MTHTFNKKIWIDLDNSPHVLFFIKADIVFAPIMIEENKITLKHKQILQYNGVKEDIYVSSFRPSKEQANLLDFDRETVIITVRVPAVLAHYYSEKSSYLFEFLIKYLSKKDNIKVIFAPRTKDQEIEIIQVWQNQFISGHFSFLSFVMNGLDLIWNSDLVIRGGTMIREADALNVPAYSTFGSQLGAVDSYLESIGRLIVLRDETDIKNKIKFEKLNH